MSDNLQSYLPVGILWSNYFFRIIFLSYFQVLIKLIKPYTRIQIKFISGELNIESGDVESLLVSCILDNTISGRIDQVQNVKCRIIPNMMQDSKPCQSYAWCVPGKVSGVLELDQSSEGSARYVALDKWNNQLNNLQKLVVNKMAWLWFKVCSVRRTVSPFIFIQDELQDRQWRERFLVTRVYKEGGLWIEDSPGIIVIRAFHYQLAELRSQSTCFRDLFVLCRQDHHGRYGGRVHRWEGIRI